MKREWKRSGEREEGYVKERKDYRMRESRRGG